MEAVSATGASPIEVVRYAVVPQIIPDFISFIIYHWDINVRISTILGFVGGGGIGFYLSQRINVLEYQKAGTAIWAIVIVVWRWTSSAQKCGSGTRKYILLFALPEKVHPS